MSRAKGPPSEVVHIRLPTSVTARLDARVASGKAVVARAVATTRTEYIKNIVVDHLSRTEIKASGVRDRKSPGPRSKAAKSTGRRKPSA
jgi:hypothetical protein